MSEQTKGGTAAEKKAAAEKAAAEKAAAEKAAAEKAAAEKAAESGGGKAAPERTAAQVATLLGEVRIRAFKRGKDGQPARDDKGRAIVEERAVAAGDVLSWSDSEAVLADGRRVPLGKGAGR